MDRYTTTETTAKQVLKRDEGGELVFYSDVTIEIESLTAERDELKRRLDEEFANMDATMQGWEKLCADSERDAFQIETLTAANQRLRTALEDAINECEFDYLRTRWRLVLNENGEK